MVTAQQLHSISKDIKLCDIDKYLLSINKAMVTYHINTRFRVCAFLAQLIHESEFLSRMRENMNYSAEAIMNTFGSHFNKYQASAYEYKPELIADRAYADRMGNGPETSGDGWKYRGGGGLGATGKDMYVQLSKELSLDLVSRPELIESPDVAMMSAGFIWAVVKGCNELADSGDIKKTTKSINGGFNGLDKRTVLYNAALIIIF